MGSDWKIPLYKVYSDDDEVKIVTDVIKRGTFWAIGPEIEQFEKEISNYVEANYCVTFNSGTSALHASMIANGIKPQDEVIVPSFSFISTANSVLFVDAKPVFSDIENTNIGLDPNLILEKITDKTKAILPMDYGGLPCKINELRKICDDNNLILIEDAAESIGSSVNGKKIGSISDSTIFSFCGNKVMTTGEGGAVVTNSKEIYEKLKLIRSHGRVDKNSYFDNPLESDYEHLGYNWRMSSITAALGLAQIRKLDKLINLRRHIASFFSSSFSKIHQITLPPSPDGYEHVFQMYPIRLPDKSTRDALQQFLIQKKIFSKVYFSPIHLREFYKKKFSSQKNSLPITENMSDTILTLPIYPGMTTEEQNYLVNSVNEFFELNS